MAASRPDCDHAIVRRGVNDNKDATAVTAGATSACRALSPNLDIDRAVT